MIGAIITLIFSLMPDLDEFSSKISKKLRPLSFITNILPHRGIMHNFIFVTVICLLLVIFFDASILIFVFIGLLSHLLLDALTHSGIMFFYPVSKKKLKFNLKSGGFIEKILFWLFVIADIVLLSINP
jgi:inner membrane protein